MNDAYFRKIVSDEIRETLIFCGFVDDYHCKTKENDSKGKTRYRFETTIGQVLVYSYKLIFINDKKFTSVNNFKLHLINYF